MLVRASGGIDWLPGIFDHHRAIAVSISQSPS
jgi:hypothetical protein